MTDNELDFLESQIPELAEYACKKVYYDTLNSGYSVLESINGRIYRTFPSGRREFIKEVGPDIICTSKKFSIIDNNWGYYK